MMDVVVACHILRRILLSVDRAVVLIKGKGGSSLFVFCKLPRSTAIPDAVVCVKGQTQVGVFSYRGLGVVSNERNSHGHAAQMGMCCLTQVVFLGWPLIISNTMSWPPKKGSSTKVDPQSQPLPIPSLSSF